jgi:hypothetical protein
MFHFEDPIAIDVLQNGPVLSGMGCGAGLPVSANPAGEWRSGLCGPITGTFEAGHLRFSFPADDFSKHVYRVEADVAANGRRMTGRLVSEGGVPQPWAFAWLPIGDDEPWLLMQRNPALSAAVLERSASYELAAVGAPPTDLDEASRSDRLWIMLLEQRGGAMVTGSLGSFCADEMTWDPATETLVAGPVPPTVPGLPIKLVITFAGRTVAGVEATMPSGAVYRFQIVVRAP